MAVTLFAGCGDEKSADSQGNQSSGDAKTVTMMSWYSEDQMDDVIDAIEKKLGGEYKIDYTYVTNSDYFFSHVFLPPAIVFLFCFL